MRGVTSDNVSRAHFHTGNFILERQYRGQCMTCGLDRRWGAEERGVFDIWKSSKVAVGAITAFLGGVAVRGDGVVVGRGKNRSRPQSQH